jgi:hypothetical protein
VQQIGESQAGESGQSCLEHPPSIDERQTLPVAAPKIGERMPGVGWSVTRVHFNSRQLIRISIFMNAARPPEYIGICLCLQSGATTD